MREDIHIEILKYCNTVFHIDDLKPYYPRNELHNFIITNYKLISASWLRSELSKIKPVVPNNVQIEKLTGDNTRMEKERVMELFRDG